MIATQLHKISYFIKKHFNMLMEPVIGYTRVVFATKFILSFIAAMLMLTLVLLPLFNPVHDNYRITFSNIEGNKDEEEPRMLNPSFQGVDKDDQTYSISAKSAIKRDEDTLIMEDINASINMPSGSWITLVSKSGVLKHKENSLELTDSVTLFTNDGFNFYTKAISVDIDKNIAYGHNKLHGTSPYGTLTADSFIAYDKGQHTVLKGNIHVILYPEQKAFLGEQDG